MSEPLEVEWVSRTAAVGLDPVRRHLRPATTVLDVGCGIRPQTLLPAAVHICVEPHRPYLDHLRERVGGDRRFVFLNATWDVALPLLPEASVDTVVALDVVEHLDKAEGAKLIDEALRIARHQVVVFTPLGFYPQSYERGEKDRWGMDGGDWQTHRSGWEPADFAGWRVVACADFHNVDADDRPVDEPFGAFWAIHDRASRNAQRIPPKVVDAPSAESSMLPVTESGDDPRPSRRSGRRPRILFVAMANSQHSARWIAQLEGRGWNLFLFPSELPTIVPITPLLHELAPSVEVVEGWPIPGGGRNLALRLTRPFNPGWNVRAWQLVRMVRKLRPDLVHSLEIQHAGYLTYDALRACGDEFPPWIVSNWGSDTYIFGRLAEHRSRIADVLSAADLYTAECQRDVAGARELGFSGVVLPVLPAAGGVDVEAAQRYRARGAPSARRVIALRGYQGWAGRALVGLRAIERAADVLGDYSIVVYNWATSPEIPIAVELAAKRTGLDFQLLPYGPREEVWRLHGRSRALVALSIGDGISTSMLEAITMGSFPIQSNTSCADEWITHGRSGFLVEPEDVEDVESALRRVVSDGQLVDDAARLNDEVVRTRLDSSVVVPQALMLYEQALESVTSE